MRRALAAVAATALLLVMPVPASATNGELHITSSTTLNFDHTGNVVIDASGVTLDCANHSIVGSGVPGTVGIRADGVSDVTIKRCVVSGFDPHGIYAFGSTGLHLQGNTVLGSWGHGIFLSESPEAVISNNTIRDGGYLDPYGGYGVVLVRSSGARITGNTATGNTWAGFALVDDSSRAVVSSNLSARNGDGFHIEPASDLTFSRNVARDNYNFGFVVNGLRGGRFTANTVTGNGSDGFNIQASSGLDIAANVVRTNNNGFFLDGTPDAGLVANVVSDNRDIGVWVGSNCDRAIIRLNIASNNGAHGIRVHQAADARLVGNVATGNEIGFDFIAATGLRVEANVARANRWAGFSLYDAVTGGTFTMNIAPRNASFGFVLQDGPTGNTFTDNTAYGNGEIDALQTDTAGPNTWLHNHFGTQVGF